MISAIISRLVILVFGTLYPAYASYKAVRTKNLKEYVKWMMYWIVFALFTCTETVTDVFLSWFPFYYEVKIVIVLWLLSPATKGSSILYRKFVHPALCRREQEIDEYIAKAKDQGYHTVLNLGTKGVNYATTVIMQTAIKGGGGLVQQIRKSYSLSDLSECDPRDERTDETDDVLAEQMVVRRTTSVRSGYNTRRSASESSTKSPIYFSEVDVDVRTRNSRIDEPDLSHIKSSEDISSGYSSADNSGTPLSRGPTGGRPRARHSPHHPAAAPRASATALRRPAPAEDSEVIIEELQEDDAFDYTNMPVLVNVPSQLYLSQTNPPFIYQYIGDEMKIIQMLGEIPSHSHEVFNEKDDPVVVDNIDKESNSVKNENVCEPVIEKDSLDNSSDLVDSNNNENPVTVNESDSVVQLSIESETINLNIDKELDSVKNENVCEQVIKKDSLDNSSDLVNSKNNENPVTVNESDPVAQLSEESATIHLNDTDEGKEDAKEVTLVPSSVYHDASEESDDENSFGTPEDSPLSKRKSPKGRYGKGKAPPPPDTQLVKTKADDVTSTTSVESLNDIVKSLPNVPFKDTYSPITLTVNPIAEKKRRHKSKSPNRLVKTSSAAIGKLLQLPSKIAFWNKSEKGDNSSVSSADESRRSSIIENVDEFQSCTDLAKIMVNVNETIDENIVHISLKESSENETINQDILDKSDVLKKLIEAKLESHPEYKVTEIPTTSTSTDV